MTAPTTPDVGLASFLADLEAEGCKPSRDGEVVRYHVIPVSGRYAGTPVATGVSVNEVQGWPTVPPHWIHLPDEITFTQTNVDTQDCLTGWRRHSRDTGPWTLDRKPILVWLAHVRGVIGQAV